MNSAGRDELVGLRLQKAMSTLGEIELHIQNQFWNTAVNRLYYASFYAVSALLLSKEINSKTHSGTKQLFGLHFVKPGLISEESGDFYTIIFDLRHSGDYIDYFVFEPDEIVSLLPSAQKLLQEINKILYGSSNK